MKKLLTVTALSLAISAFAEGDENITVKVDALSNVARSTVLEACGTAIHKDGKKPLLVTVKHSDATYTTLTDADGKWCVLLARRTFNGAVDATAQTLLP